MVRIDGKTILKGGGQQALHIVSVWCEAKPRVLAHEKVDDKSSENTVIPTMPWGLSGPVANR